MTDVAFTHLSAKGQIVIPAAIRRRMKLRKGRKLVVIAEGGRLLIEEADRLEKIVADDFSGLLKASSSSTKFWMNEKDEVWNDA